MKPIVILSIIFSFVLFDSFGASAETEAFCVMSHGLATFGDGREIDEDAGDRGDAPVSVVTLNATWHRRFDERASSFDNVELYGSLVPDGYLVVDGTTEDQRRNPLIGLHAEGFLSSSLKATELSEESVGDFVYIKSVDGDGDCFIRGLVSRILLCEHSGRKSAEIFLGSREDSRCAAQIMLPLGESFSRLIWKSPKVEDLSCGLVMLPQGRITSDLVCETPETEIHPCGLVWNVDSDPFEE